LRRGDDEEDAGREVGNLPETGAVMGDSAKNLMEIYDDIDLCYKVMGLTFSDNPERVDRVYKGLMEEYDRDLKSNDPAVRKQAQENIDQTKDLYERITGSMIYKDYAREYEKYKQLKEEERKEKQLKAEAARASMIPCPHCGKLISASLKSCMYCNKSLPSAAVLKLKGMFSGMFGH
jgi:hypothetical protein